jgi:hypothetical protein
MSTHTIAQEIAKALDNFYHSSFWNEFNLMSASPVAKKQTLLASLGSQTSS